MKPTASYDCIFRVDAGGNTGLGHLRRSLVLAKALHRKLKRIAFLTRTPKVVKQWLPKTYPVIPLKDENRWPQELIQCPPPLTIIDSYRITERHLLKLKQFLPKIVAFDDFTHLKRYPVDAIINYQIYAKRLKYRALSHTLFFLGSKYTLIDSSFKRLPVKKKSASGKRLFITMGGCPSPWVVKKIRRVIASLEPGLAVDIAGAIPHNLLRSVSQRVRLIDPHRIAKAMNRADLALSAAGVTCFELVFLGVPNLLVVLAKNQIRTARGMHRHGAVKYLGWFKDLRVSSIVREINRLRETPVQSRKISQRVMQLIDGRGSERLANALIKNFIEGRK